MNLSSPFIHNQNSVQGLMLKLQLAAIPAIAAHVYVFGWGILIHIVLALVTALAAEALMLRLRQRPIRPFLFDNSVMITAVAIAFCMPPTAPWWTLVFAVSFGVIIGKHLYGGLGYNPFNPAMLGYAVLLISFPAQMSSWIEPAFVSGQYLSFGQTFSQIFGLTSAPTALIDSMTSATPLDLIKTQVSQGLPVNEFQWAPRVTDQGWAWINAAFVLGGVWLLWQRVIHWRVPTALLGTLALLSGFFWWLDPQIYASPLTHLSMGGIMLVAFFIATDPVTSAATPRGRLIYAALIGALIYVIRTWGAYPDGIAFAVLLANMCVPLIDHYTQPRVYGYKK
jgi:electron transport complex protein RnfD